MSQLETVLDWDQRVTQYTYTAQGQLYQVVLSNGVTSTYLYNGAGWLSDLLHTHGEEELGSYHYAYTPSGNRSQVVEHIAQPLEQSTLPSAPTDLSAAQQGYQAIALSWADQAANESGYVLQRSTDGETWQALAELGADVSSYLDDGLLRHTDYRFQTLVNSPVYFSSARARFTSTVDAVSPCSMPV